MAALARVHTHACSILPHRYVLRALPACAACRARPLPRPGFAPGPGRGSSGSRQPAGRVVRPPHARGGGAGAAPRARAVRRERRASGRTPPARMRIFARPIEDEWTEAESRDGQFRADATGNVEHPSEHRRSVRSERVSGSVNLENARIQNTTFYAIHTRAALRPVNDAHLKTRPSLSSFMPNSTSNSQLSQYRHTSVEISPRLPHALGVTDNRRLRHAA